MSSTERRSEKDVFMNWEVKEKAWWELAEVSKLPVEEPMYVRRLRGEREKENGLGAESGKKNRRK